MIIIKVFLNFLSGPAALLKTKTEDFGILDQARQLKPDLEEITNERR
jgi:hypothetical protein